MFPLKNVRIKVHRFILKEKTTYILAIDLEWSSAVAFVSYITKTKVLISVGNNHATDVNELHLIERNFDRLFCLNLII